MIACSKETIDRKKEGLEKMMKGIQEACEIFRTREGIVDEIAQRYGLKKEDAHA